MKVAPEDVAVLLEMLGDGKAQGPVTLPDWVANAIAEILKKTLPAPRGRPRRVVPLPDRDKTMPLKAQAREIAAATGGKAVSIGRRLQEKQRGRKK